MNPTNHASSYVQICILNTLGKVLEGLIVQILKNYIEEREGVLNLKSGFWKGSQQSMQYRK